jgi:hypothetical protein
MADFADPSLQDLSGSSGMKRPVAKLDLTSTKLEVSVLSYRRAINLSLSSIL